MAWPDGGDQRRDQSRVGPGFSLDDPIEALAVVKRGQDRYGGEHGQGRDQGIDLVAGVVNGKRCPCSGRYTVALLRTVMRMTSAMRKNAGAAVSRRGIPVPDVRG